MNKQIFYGLIGLGYALIGGFVLKTHFFIIFLEKTQALLLGSLFIVYGLFRVYRAYRAYREDN